METLASILLYCRKMLSHVRKPYEEESMAVSDFLYSKPQTTNA